MKKKLFEAFAAILVLESCLEISAWDLETSTKDKKVSAKTSEKTETSADDIFIKQKVSAKDKEEIIQLVEKYLNDLSEFQGSFEQFITKTGEVSKGKVFIKRPSLIRVEYEAPNPHILVIDDKKIRHYDRELKEQTEFPKKSSPFSMFLNKKISLGKNVTDVSVDHAHIYLKLKSSNKDEKSLLHLVFSEAPIRLYQWSVINPDGSETSITITKYKNKIDSNLSNERLKNCNVSVIDKK